MPSRAAAGVAQLLSSLSGTGGADEAVAQAPTPPAPAQAVLNPLQAAAAGPAAAPLAAPPAKQPASLAPPVTLRLLGAPLEPLLLLLLSALGGYIGTLLRVASSYIRPIRGWELFPGTYSYPNIIGCFLFGMIAPHKAAMTRGSLVPRLLYHFVASGLVAME